MSVCGQFVKFGAFKAFEVSVLQGCLLDVLDVAKVFSGCLRGVPRVFQGCLNGVSMVS